MDPILLTIASNLYDTSPEELIPLSGGHYNAVFQFPLIQATQVLPAGEVPDSKKFGILRIGVEDCPYNQTMGMLEWVNFLSHQGAPVSAPLRSINNHLLERVRHYGTVYNLTAFEKAEGILAENIQVSEWSTEVFQSIGKAAGKLHRISAGLQALPSVSHQTTMVRFIRGPPCNGEAGWIFRSCSGNAYQLDPGAAAVTQTKC